MEQGGGLYRLRWEDLAIIATLDRIREDSHHMVTAEITVKSAAPGTPTHLHGPARLNLTSTASRRTLAKALSDRVNNVDWYAVIEQTCVMVLENLRIGEPIIDLSTYVPVEQAEYRLEPLLVEKQANLFYGPGGIGKSYLAAFLALLIDIPWTAAGFIPEPGKVLYLDYEAGANELHERLEGLRRGLDIEVPCQVLYRFCHQPLASDMAEIQRLIVEHKIELVIVDSVGLACGGEPESAEVVLRYFSALRSFRTTSLSIDHVAKHGQEKTPFGSIYKMNVSRSVWEIKGTQEPGEDKLRLGLFHRKVNRGRLCGPLGLCFNFEEDGSVSVKREDIRDVPELAEGLSLKSRIASELRRGPMTVKEIADELSSPESTIRVVLNRWKGKHFIKLGDTWGNLVMEERNTVT